jgi:hypothetical protein
MNHAEIAADLTRVDPDYTGGSILNLVATIARHFGLDTGHQPLNVRLPLDGATTVILLIVDALGEHQLRHHLSAGDLPVLERLLTHGEASLSSVTSTFPSTTAAALTTLHTGKTPAQHGLLGFTIWLEDRQAVANTLLFRDLLTGKPLADAASLMTVPSLYRQLPELVSNRVVVPASIKDSLLSRWHFAGAEIAPYRRLARLPDLVAEAVSGTRPGYIVAYWPDYDTTCHVHGPESSAAGSAARFVDAALGRLIEMLPFSDDTLLLLSADHGQRAIEPNETVILNDDPELVSHLASPPMGERCARYLRVAPGMDAAVADHLSPLAEVIPMADVWADGLFGDSRGAELFRSRTGDLLAIPRDHRQLAWAFTVAGRKEIYRGGHGGWTAAEMLVPIVAIRR